MRIGPFYTMNRFHEAAREGRLDLLRDATRRDANKPDDTGRTPTLWAAYEGKTDALRLLVTRGGDPDHCDLQGYTALHYAALSGHTNTVTFLVSFGCNIWAMTNDYRTAKELAAENNHEACLNLLDDITAEQSAKNNKQVKKLKEKALVDADKRIKKLSKMQAEHAKWLEKEEKKTPKHPRSGNLYTKKSGSKLSPILVTRKGHRHSSAAVLSEFNASNGVSGGRGRSKSALLPRYADDNRSRSTADTKSIGSDRNSDEEEDQTSTKTRPDIREHSFWRPVDGSGMVKSVQSLPPGKANHDDDIFDEDLLSNAVNIEHDYSKANHGVDHGVPKILVSKPSDRRESNTAQTSNDWNPEDFDEDDNDIQTGTTLEFFLSMHNLLDYLPEFKREEIDLKALTLLTDEDLIKLGLPLGPRRKLTDAISRRQNVMSAPGVMSDTQI